MKEEKMNYFRDFIDNTMFQSTKANVFKVLSKRSFKRLGRTISSHNRTKYQILSSEFEVLMHFLIFSCSISTTIEKTVSVLKNLKILKQSLLKETNQSLQQSHLTTFSNFWYQILILWFSWIRVPNPKAQKLIQEVEFYTYHEKTWQSVVVNLSYNWMKRIKKKMFFWLPRLQRKRDLCWVYVMFDSLREGEK